MPWPDPVPLDMVAYLLLVQALPALNLVGGRYEEPATGRFLLAAQSALIVVFLLVWGGYAKDSWDYLIGFDRTPFTYNDEWLFWIVGYLLNKIVYDPWPLKLLSALGGAIMCWVIVSYFADRGWRYAAAGLFVLLLVPGFYLAMGSAVRQGLAGALVALGVVNLYRDRNRAFVACCIVAYFFHQYSILLAAAGVASRLRPGWAVYALVAAPFAGYAAFHLAAAVGVELDRWVPYTDKHEGYFYWSKFFVAYVLAAVALLLTRRAQGRDAWVVAAYVYMVACSALLLRYEVPFERLLAYSDLLLPLVAVLCIDAVGWGRWRIAGLWAAAVATGVVLWTHPSIITTLGYSGG